MSISWLRAGGPPLHVDNEEQNQHDCGERTSSDQKAAEIGFDKAILLFAREFANGNHRTGGSTTAAPSRRHADTGSGSRLDDNSLVLSRRFRLFQKRCRCREDILVRLCGANFGCPQLLLVRALHLRTGRVLLDRGDWLGMRDIS